MKRPTPIHIKLRDERRRQRLNHDQLATLTGLRRETICRIEAGHGAHLHSIAVIADALGLELTLLPHKPITELRREHVVEALVEERYGGRPWRGAA